jgi:radical SAM-linked protein
LCRKVRDTAREADRHLPRIQVTASISPFVPKANTPFQWEAQISRDETRRRVDTLRDLARGERLIKLRWHDPDMSWLEGVLARGDRRLADVVERAYRHGALFCSWIEGFSLAPWLRALEEENVCAAGYTGGRDPELPLPWEHLACGVSRRFLLAERERAKQGLLTPDCRYDACRQCGVCGTGDASAGITAGVVGGEAASIRNRLNFAARDQREALCPDPAARKELEEPPHSPPGNMPSPGSPRIPAGTSPELAVKAVRYRVWHAKKGLSAFLSQLELQPLLERAMRRAGLPLAFSQGFHPLPLISFGRALPVGMESEAEWFSATLREPMSADALWRALQPCMLPGMDLGRVEAIPVHGKTLGASRERFVVSLMDSQPSAAVFLDMWRAFAEASCRPFTYESKKGPRTLDLRPLLESFTPRDPAGPSDPPAVAFVLHWETGYLSPLAFVRAVLPDISPERLRLVKLEQQLEGWKPW